MVSCLSLFQDADSNEDYPLSLHDGLPIYDSLSRAVIQWPGQRFSANGAPSGASSRSEEHTSELQSLAYPVCRLLLEKTKQKNRASTQSRLLAQLQHGAAACARR